MQSSQRQVLNGLSLNTLGARSPASAPKKAYDTQTVLQLIYQQQHQQENSACPAQQQAAQRYKTELCRTFQENGICKYGDKCQFAHGLGELRTMSRHPKYKTELCRTFHASGYCPYGPRCHFVHDTQIDTKSAKSPQLSVKLNNYSSSSSSSASSGSTSPLSLNGFVFDLSTELNSMLPQSAAKHSSNNLLMCANEFSCVSERKQSVSSDSVFGSESLSSPASSRSLSPDFMFPNQAKRLYDDWDCASSDSIVNQILNNVVQLDEQEDCDAPANDLTLNYLNLLI